MTMPHHAPHIESVRHKTTSVTLVASEFEADVRVESKRQVAEGVVALTLHEVGGHPLPPWQPGAHIDLILGDAPTRQYSLCGDPANHHLWRLGILRDPNGHGSSLYVHDRLQVNDTVRVRGPRNNFPLVDSPRYLFIAGGIGITPLLPMIAAAEAAGAEWELLYGAFEVVLQQSELTLIVPPDRSILSVVEEAGVGVLSSCNEGTCGTCETRVIGGVPDHRDSVLTKEERQANDCMMICVSRSCTRGLVLDL